MPVISLDQLIDKTLTAKKPVKIYKSIGGEVVTIVKPGLSVGVVYSWVGEPGKNLYFMFYAPLTKLPYYAKYEPGAFNYDLLREQGVKTTSEIIKEKEEEKKPTSEKIIDFSKKYLIWAGVGLGAYLILREFIRKK